MTTQTNQKVLGVAAGVLCGLQLFDVPDVWREGHRLIAVIVALAAIAGFVIGVSNAVRPGLEPPPTAMGRGYGGWNAKVNTALFFYFVATVAVSVVKPWGLRSLTGIIGVIGI